MPNYSALTAELKYSREDLVRYMLKFFGEGLAEFEAIADQDDPNSPCMQSLMKAMACTAFAKSLNEAKDEGEAYFVMLAANRYLRWDLIDPDRSNDPVIDPQSDPAASHSEDLND